MLATAPAPSVRPDSVLIVEDDRPGSGHMQVNLPAPREGFFSPAVRLGDHVRQGQLFGVVSDAVGDDERHVVAPHAGIVIVLHTFARVDDGECLGVVLQREAAP
jgi:predicted deacylase